MPLGYLRDPLRNEILALIDGLPRRQQRELVALTWIGRGDFNAEDFEAVVHQQAEVAAKGGSVGGYLIGKAPLGSYLRSGLSALNAR